MKIELLGFTVPNYVIQKMPQRPRQEGLVESPKYTLAEVPADDLASLCDHFRSEVFRKAGKVDPALEGRWMATRKDCSGCRDDFYNHNRMGLNEAGGQPECWNLKAATMVEARDVPINMPPPYKALPMVRRPGCYNADGYVRVKSDALRADGFWR